MDSRAAAAYFSMVNAVGGSLFIDYLFSTYFDYIEAITFAIAAHMICTLNGSLGDASA